jgi:hypothetical protein
LLLEQRKGRPSIVASVEEQILLEKELTGIMILKEKKKKEGGLNRKNCIG